MKVILGMFVFCLAIFRQCHKFHGDHMQRKYTWIRPFQPEENTINSVPVEKEYLGQGKFDFQ